MKLECKCGTSYLFKPFLRKDEIKLTCHCGEVVDVKRYFELTQMLKGMKELREQIENSFKGKYVNGLDRKVLTNELTLIALKYAMDVCLWKVSEKTNGLDVALELRELIKELE